jgi:hypothetical protein
VIKIHCYININPQRTIPVRDSIIPLHYYCILSHRHQYDGPEHIVSLHSSHQHHPFVDYTHYFGLGPPNPPLHRRSHKMGLHFRIRCGKTRVGFLQRFPIAGLPPLSTQTPHQGQSPKTLGQIRAATNLPSGRRGGSARSPQPLVYSFYVQNHCREIHLSLCSGPERSPAPPLPTRRSQRSFCYLDEIILDCEENNGCTAGTKCAVKFLPPTTISS